MTPIDRFERRLPDELQELASERFPDYTNDLLARTARTRQRPAWSLPMRWLPMTIALRRPFLAPPMRLLAVGLALLLALLAALAVGGLLLTPRPTPMPAVEAATWKNGLVAFGREGDIWVAEPTVDGQARVLIGGPTTDDEPDWSPDGTRIAWWRTDGAGVVLMVADADGSNIKQVTADRVFNPSGFWWSPDGSTFLITSTIKRMPVAWTIPSDGGSPTVLPVEFPVTAGAWRPDGRGFLVRGANHGLTGLYPVSWPDLTVGDPIIQSDPTSDFYTAYRGAYDFQYPYYSADGAQIGFIAGMDNGDGEMGLFGAPDTRNHVMDADGSNDRMVEFDPASDYEDSASISPDGTEFAMLSRKGHVLRLVLVKLDGSTPPLATGPQPESAYLPIAWSPDGTELLVIHTDDGLARLIDPGTGTETTLPWQGGSFDWQPIPG